MALAVALAAEGVPGVALCDRGASRQGPHSVMRDIAVPRGPCDTAEPRPARGLCQGRAALACPVPGEPLRQSRAAPGISLRQTTSETQEDKVNPNSQAPSPSPSWL